MVARRHPPISGWLPVALLMALWILGGCTMQPTPFQPLAEGYGYEETQLQEKLYKVTFRANRATPESRVLDFLYLRSAELTRQAGFSHFLIQQDFGKTQAETQARSQFRIGLGLYSGISRGGGWGMGGSMPLSSSEYDTVVSYHLGVFIVRMLTAEEAREDKNVFEVNFLIDSIRRKITQRAAGTK